MESSNEPPVPVFSTGRAERPQLVPVSSTGGAERPQLPIEDQIVVNQIRTEALVYAQFPATFIGMGGAYLAMRTGRLSAVQKLAVCGLAGLYSGLVGKLLYIPIGVRSLKDRLPADSKLRATMFRQYPDKWSRSRDGILTSHDEHDESSEFASLYEIVSETDPEHPLLDKSRYVTYEQLSRQNIKPQASDDVAEFVTQHETPERRQRINKYGDVISVDD